MYKKLKSKQYEIVIYESIDILFPTVSLIVVTKNRLNHLKKCLESIKNQSFLNKELIVFDDASKDDTWDYLKRLIFLDEFTKKFSRIVIIKSKKDVFKAKAVNIALCLAKGRYVTIVDDDNILTRNTIEEMFVTICKKENSFVGAISIDPASRMVWSTGVKIVWPGLHSKYELKDNMYEVDSLQNVFMFPRNIVNYVGFWDSTIIKFQDEDEDFQLRAKNLVNANMIVLPNAITLHTKPNLRNRLKNVSRAFFYLRSRPILVMRHFSWYWKISYIIFFPVILGMNVLYLLIVGVPFKNVVATIFGAIEGFKLSISRR